MNKLKKELAITMDEIMAKEQLMDLIDSATHRLIPIPCVEIIFDYVSFVEFIDWAHF